MIRQEPLPEPKTQAEHIMRLHLVNAIRKKSTKNPAAGLGFIRQGVQKYGSYIEFAKVLEAQGKKG